MTGVLIPLLLILCGAVGTRAIQGSRALEKEYGGGGVVCQYSALAVLPSQPRNGFKPVPLLEGCSYAIADNKFYNLVDTSSPPKVVAKADIPFAHEAPVFLPGLNKIFFVSNRLGDLSSDKQYMELQTLDLATGQVNKLPRSLTDNLLMANGATIWPGTDDTIALLTQGNGTGQPGAVNKVNLRALNSEVVLNSYFGRRFNSPNDIAFYKDGQTLFFTDPPYGYAHNFKPRPELGNSVYAFNRASKIPAVAADGFVKPNGIAFSPDYKTAYVTDTGLRSGTSEPPNPANPQAIYAFDVSAPAAANGQGSFPTLHNRRTFAVAAADIPDGIKVDAQGNVYAATGAGVEVFAATGQRLGTILVDGGVANLVFAGNVLYALADKRIVSVKLKVSGARLP